MSSEHTISFLALDREIFERVATQNGLQLDILSEDLINNFAVIQAIVRSTNSLAPTPQTHSPTLTHHLIPHTRRN